MKIGWKIRKLWHFEVSQILRKDFLTSPYEYANEWDDDVIASKFSIHFVHRNYVKISYFSYKNVRLALITHLKRCRIMLTLIYLDMRDITIKTLGKKYKFSKFYVQNIWQVVRRWHHQLTHLHIHKDWSRNVSWKFAKLESVITSLFFNRFYIRFLLFCSENFTLSSEIKLDQLRISPLMINSLLHL